jgi:hypothetical protein
MQPGDLISAFMKRIGRADRVIVVLSDKYLRSPYCMTSEKPLEPGKKRPGTRMFDRCRRWRSVVVGKILLRETFHSAFRRTLRRKSWPFVIRSAGQA